MDFGLKLSLLQTNLSSLSLHFTFTMQITLDVEKVFYMKIVHIFITLIVLSPLNCYSSAHSVDYDAASFQTQLRDVDAGAVTRFVQDLCKQGVSIQQVIDKLQVQFDISLHDAALLAYKAQDLTQQGFSSTHVTALLRAFCIRQADVMDRAMIAAGTRGLVGGEKIAGDQEDVEDDCSLCWYILGGGCIAGLAYGMWYYWHHSVDVAPVGEPAREPIHEPVAEPVVEPIRQPNLPPIYEQPQVPAEPVFPKPIEQEPIQEGAPAEHQEELDVDVVIELEQVDRLQQAQEPIVHQEVPGLISPIQQAQIHQVQMIQPEQAKEIVQAAQEKIILIQDVQPEQDLVLSQPEPDVIVPIPENPSQIEQVVPTDLGPRNPERVAKNRRRIFDNIAAANKRPTMVEPPQRYSPEEQARIAANRERIARQLAQARKSAGMNRK